MSHTEKGFFKVGEENFSENTLIACAFFSKKNNNQLTNVTFVAVKWKFMAFDKPLTRKYLNDKLWSFTTMVGALDAVDK